jgi:hypothetical protein
VKKEAVCLHNHYAELAYEKEKRNFVPVKILRGERASAASGECDDQQLPNTRLALIIRII